MGQMEFNTRDLRRAFGTFLTGVTIVTTRDATGERKGMTANSFTSVSLNPALVLICVGKGSSNITAFEEAKSFAINVLHSGQESVASLFAAKGVDRFAGVETFEALTGAPVLKDCLGWFDCTPHRHVDAGDHIILIGEVQAYGMSEHEPLGFHRGGFMRREALLAS